MLAIRNLFASYGALPVLRDVNMEMAEAEIVCILGANGAGKSTLLRAISGVLRPQQGNVLFDGHDLAKLAASEIVRLGVAHVPEGRQLFGSLSVFDNLKLGAYIHFSKLGKKQVEKVMKNMLELFQPLRHRLKQRASTLSGGEQQMLAVGRALMSDPKLLLLDEPSLGLAPLIVKSIFLSIGELRKTGMTILLVEQNVRVALEVSDRGYVMQNGTTVLQGSSTELAGHEELKAVYLSKQ